MDYDLIIIGAGPGGYVAAVRAGQTGLKTAVIEKTRVGGMCLNWGCIPTKALLEAGKRLLAVKDAADFGIDGIDNEKLGFNWERAKKRVDFIVKRLTRGVEFLLKKNGVKLITGTAAVNREKSVSVENMLLSAKNIIIATGSKPVKPAVSLPGEVLVEVEDLMKLKELPESTVVLGHGPHAVELAQFFKMVDKKVALVAQEPMLIPDAGPFLSAYAEKILKKSGVNVILSARVKGYKDGELRLEMDGKGKGAEKITKKIPCDKVINASARKAVIPEFEDPPVKEKGFLKVDDYLETSVPGIHAAGDVNGRSIFAHAASAQGLYVVDRINGIHRESLFDSNKFPINIYTYPEIAQVGFTEMDAEESNTRYRVSEFPLTSNGKALIEGAGEGIVRMLSDRKYGEVLGVQIVAPHATDMIAEASLIMQMEGTVHDVAQTIHAHPTVSEIVMEAGFDAFGQAIHK